MKFFIKSYNYSLFFCATPLGSIAGRESCLSAGGFPMVRPPAVITPYGTSGANPTTPEGWKLRLSEDRTKFSLSTVEREQFGRSQPPISFIHTINPVGGWQTLTQVWYVIWTKSKNTDEDITPPVEYPPTPTPKGVARSSNRSVNPELAEGSPAEMKDIKNSYKASKMPHGVVTVGNLAPASYLRIKKKPRRTKSSRFLKNGGDLLSHDATQYHRREWA